MDTTLYRSGPVLLGDTIVLLGQAHIVTAVGARRNGFGEPIADCADGWSISLDPDGALRVPSPNETTCVLATGTPA